MRAGGVGAQHAVNESIDSKCAKHAHKNAVVLGKLIAVGSGGVEEAANRSSVLVTRRCADEQRRAHGKQACEPELVDSKAARDAGEQRIGFVEQPYPCPVQTERALFDAHHALRLRSLRNSPLFNHSVPPCRKARIHYKSAQVYIRGCGVNYRGQPPFTWDFAANSYLLILLIPG